MRSLLVLGVGACLVWGGALGVQPLRAVEEQSRLQFREVSTEWGIEFTHRHGGQGEFYMTETMGAGVVVFDFDSDGDLDLFLVDSGNPHPQGEVASASKLLRNDRGRFVDVTARSGLRIDDYGMGAVSADVDGDGDLDLFVTTFGRSQLFVNQGDGRFVDASERSELAQQTWSSSASFGDADGDLDLDLYVAGYVDFDYDRNIPCGVKERELRSYCHPNVYRGLPDRLLRNRGDGTFEDATVSSGLEESRGNGLGVVFGHFDDDERPDVYVANDMNANFVWIGQSDGRFEDLGLLSGAALSERGEAEAGMGVAIGDLDRDGREDLVVTHLDRQTNAVYVAGGYGTFSDRRFQTGLAEPSLPWVGFGAEFEDFDLDGDLDLAVANGHIIHNIENWGRGGSYRQPNQIFENDGSGRFDERTEVGLSEVRSSRGLAVGDLDLDGDADLVITNSNDAVEVYENLTTGSLGLSIELVDDGSPNRRAIGARVSSSGLGREVRAGSSYLSQSSPLLLFAGSQGEALSAEVAWPDGRRQRFEGLPSGRRVRIWRQR